MVERTVLREIDPPFTASGDDFVTCDLCGVPPCASYVTGVGWTLAFYHDGGLVVCADCVEVSHAQT